MQCTPEASKLYNQQLMIYIHIFRLITLKSIKNIVDALKKVRAKKLLSRKETRNKMEQFKTNIKKIKVSLQNVNVYFYQFITFSSEFNISEYLDITCYINWTYGSIWPELPTNLRDMLIWLSSWRKSLMRAQMTSQWMSRNLLRVDSKISSLSNNLHGKTV